jgi:hypothetical protein
MLFLFFLFEIYLAIFLLFLERIDTLIFGDLVNDHLWKLLFNGLIEVLAEILTLTETLLPLSIGIFLIARSLIKLSAWRAHVYSEHVVCQAHLDDLLATAHNYKILCLVLVKVLLDLWSYNWTIVKWFFDFLDLKISIWAHVDGIQRLAIIRATRLVILNFSFCFPCVK